MEPFIFLNFLDVSSYVHYEILGEYGCVYFHVFPYVSCYAHYGVLSKYGYFYFRMLALVLVMKFCQNGRGHVYVLCKLMFTMESYLYSLNG